MLLKHNGANLVSHNDLRIIPGVNTIPGKVWAEMKKHKTIKAYLDKEIFEEMSEEGESVDSDVQGFTEEDLNHLKQLNVPMAKALVGETFSLELLEEWAKREDRNQVKGALNKQIELLKQEPELRDRSQARQIETGGSPEEVNLGHNLKGGAADD